MNKFDEYSKNEIKAKIKELQEELSNRIFAVNAVVKLKEKSLFDTYLEPALQKKDENIIVDAEKKYKVELNKYENRISDLLKINDLRTDVALAKEAIDNKELTTNL